MVHASRNGIQYKQRQEMTVNKSQLSIMDILHTLLTHIFVILLAGAVCGAAAWAYTTYKIPKTYRTSVTFYALSFVQGQQAEEDTVTAYGITTSRQLASTYSYVLRSNVVMKEAAAKLEEEGIRYPNGSPYTYGGLKGMTVVSTTNTEIFTATFTSTDRQNLQKVANTIAEVGAAKIKDIVGGEAKILDSAEPPGSPISPDVRANTITGALIGLLIAAAFVIIRALTDTTIWSEEDLTKQYSIPVLGTVPQLAALDKQNLIKEKE